MDTKKTKGKITSSRFSKTTESYPKQIIRLDDNEIYDHTGNGYYQNRGMVKWFGKNKTENKPFKRFKKYLESFELVW